MPAQFHGHPQTKMISEPISSPEQSKPLLQIVFTDTAAIAFCQEEIKALLDKLGKFKAQ